MNDMSYYIIDASKVALGRFSTKVADILRGKNSVDFRPNIVPKNVVIVINASSVFLSASKELSKEYNSYSGYHGGLKTKKFLELKNQKPDLIIKNAVKGMLPKNKLQNVFLKNLKVFSGNNHNFSNKKLIPIED